ncbi:hypothetical protein M8818_000594 [Zalaria obscura]|uniref:Uncharacterized protein n=1 Tax=Zalaria obscura TaxID=2024903 RepID=A0ACC3SNB8_9PEZI
MPGDDLAQHAMSSVDFYELLGVTFETSEADIRRAYRKTALKYHPDKNAGKPEVIEKFHLLQIAYDVLSDPTVKALYDNARRARKEKAERESAFEGRRRQMKEDLERRESGFFKRKREEDEEEERLEREIRRLAEDGKRRRKEREEMLNREKLEEEERLDKEANGEVTTPREGAKSKGGTEVPELDRTVKVRWAKEGAGERIDKERLTTLFANFGKVENVALLKEKRQRIGDRKEKTVVATGIVVFASVVGAHAAIEDVKKQQEPEYKAFDSVFWAANKEPEFLQRTSASPDGTPPPPTTPSSTAKARTQHDIPGLNQSPSTPFKPAPNGNGLKKVPSFASFSASFSTPKNSPFGKTSTQSPSLEEITLIRLKNAEKKRLEEQIRKEEEEAAKVEEGS